MAPPTSPLSSELRPARGSTTHRPFLGPEGWAQHAAAPLLEQVGPLGKGGTAYCVWRKPAQDFKQRLVHLVRSSLIELPTAGNKQCVT